MRGQRAAGIITRGVADAATAWQRTFHFKQPPSDAKAALENIQARLLSDQPAPTAPLNEIEITLTKSAAASRVSELLAAAADFNCQSLALTDANPCGALEFAQTANSLGIKPITGGTLTLTDETRITLLTRSRQGYANLSRLLTIANAADRRESRLDPSHIPNHADGLIALIDGRQSAISKSPLNGDSAKTRA